MTETDNSLVLRQANAIAESEWSEARKKFVLENYCNDAPITVARVFMEEAMRRGLSPEAKQIYLIPRRDHGVTKWMSQTSIDGYRLMADRTRRYAGSDEAQFVYDAKGQLEKAIITVYKMVEHQRCSFTAAAYYTDYKGDTPTWKNMPRVMLAKCAEALALRKAFPAELSGIYTDAEMDQANVIEASHSVQASANVQPEAPAPKPISTQSEQIRASLTGWNQFWPWAKEHHIKNEEDFVALTGRGIKGLTPDQARDVMEASLEEMAREIHNEENGIVDGEFSDVPLFDANDPERFTR